MNYTSCERRVHYVVARRERESVLWLCVPSACLCTVLPTAVTLHGSDLKGRGRGGHGCTHDTIGIAEEQGSRAPCAHHA